MRWSSVHKRSPFTATWETLDAEVEDGRWLWRLMAQRYMSFKNVTSYLWYGYQFSDFRFQKTFHYDSHFWSDKNPYNIAGGRTGFDSQETKLPTYWNTAFSKICLGMKIGHKLRFVTITKYASSLYSLIADGQYRATSLGRNLWKSLIGPQASSNTNCDKEGFNAICSHRPHSKARIGITSSLPNSCVYCDSRIGFGTGGLHDDTNTCGNEATISPDNGDKHIKTMGYILIE